jgi:sialic acid synthase SpsE
LPDIGTFFNQDVQQALRLADILRSAGVPFIKGEVLHDPSICLPSDVTVQYLSDKKEPVTERYRGLIERKFLPLTQYEEIFRHCKTLGLGLVLSVYDTVGANFARDIGAAGLKIASSNIVHAPLIRYIAQLGLPMIIDSGRSSLDETLRAISWAREAGAQRLILEYSPPAPPTPVSEHHLRVLSRLQSVFDGPIGLSDHHAGAEILYAATALGYRVLEKGVCPNSHVADQDVYHAISADQVATALQTIHSIHAALGYPSKAYNSPARHPARMGLVASHSLRRGDYITLEDVKFAFPALGIPVEEWDKVNGQKLTADLLAGTPIEWKHVAAASA